MSSKYEIVFQKRYSTGEVVPLDATCTNEMKVTPGAVLEAIRIYFADDPDGNKYNKIVTKKIMCVFEDFCKPGDNFICPISSLNMWCEQENFELSLVVKMHKEDNDEWSAAFSQAAFLKEISFYKTILPILNDRLVKIQLQPLKFPKYFGSIEKKFKQVVLFEDLRAREFKKADSKNGLDKVQSSLTLKEIGRIHAASKLAIVEEEANHSDIVFKYPLFKEIWQTAYPSQEVMESYWSSGINFAICLLHVNTEPKYKQIQEFLENMKRDVHMNLFKMLTCKEPFRVMCHGDCWTNNFLFKYDNTQSIDCYVIDMQVVRIGSPALDLNHLIWTSVNHEVRRNYLPDLLKDYYDSFSSVMSAAGEPMPFTFEELQKEFDSKNLFGLYMALIMLKPILLNRNLLPNLRNASASKVKDAACNYQEVLEKVEKDQPLAIPTYMALFDQLYEAGLFNNYGNKE